MARCVLYVMFNAMFGCLLFSLTCEGRLDCAQRYFDGSSGAGRKVFCGPGFYECGAHDDACCNEIRASPVQLVLVILGPATVLCSFLLVGFVVKTIICSIKADKALNNVPIYRVYKE